MKDSGVPWLGKVPEHWELLRAQDVIQTEREQKRMIEKAACCR